MRKLEESIGYNAWCIRINCILKAQSMHKLRIKTKISIKEKLNNLSQNRDYKSTWKDIDSTLYDMKQQIKLINIRKKL